MGAELLESERLGPLVALFHLAEHEKEKGSTKLSRAIFLGLRGDQRGRALADSQNKRNMTLNT